MGSLEAGGPFLEVTIGSIGLVVVMFLHGVAMRIVNHGFSAVWVRFDAGTPLWRVNLLLAAVIASFTAVHLVATLFWAVPVRLLGMVGNMRDAYYFVIESYTTLGVGPVALPDQWRLIGPVIAMSGLFTFGWTGSVLVTIMNEVGKLDRARAERRHRRRAGPGG